MGSSGIREANMKNTIMVAIGTIGGLIASLFGGWSVSLNGLVLFMSLDFAMGLAVAGIFNRSKKSEGGALESRAGWKGLCKKVFTLGLVLVAHWLDRITGSTYIQDAVCIGFIANETISIIENAGLMGIWMPPVLIKAIEVLKTQNKTEVDNSDKK